MAQAPSLTAQVLANAPGNPLVGLHRADALWERYRTNSRETPQVIDVAATEAAATEAPDWDVVICGGTLGILLASTLVQRGWRVALLERGILRGRDQEWNISRREMKELVDLGLLTEAELEEAIASEYNPGRIAFHKGTELWVRDVLNIGVDPVFLLDTLKTKFLEAGGTLLEQTAFEGATVMGDRVVVRANGELSTRLLVDAMGHFSPIAQQARQGQSPDAVCMVVGTCATGYTKNDTGDLFASITPLTDYQQYFWEAFPARDGRTTYLFTYVDAHPDRPSLEDLFDDYFRLLPEYQQVELEQLQWKRALFGFFPCYRNSPLQSPWNRILHVGDSSGSQSPLSFGGFGAMIRHLPRLVQGLDEALRVDACDRTSLTLLQPYQPSLSVTWLFQQSMSAKVDQSLPPDRINDLLSAVFAEMEQLGDPVLKPFLQDVVQFPALAKTLGLVSLRHPTLVMQILPQVGVGALLDWMRHYGSLGLYTALNATGQSLTPWIKNLPPTERYRWHRRLDAWKYGSGSDFAES
ncbi:MAG: FAD-binding oxidoreductase [Cyanobacteria bacterium J06638_22]